MACLLLLLLFPLLVVVSCENNISSNYFENSVMCDALERVDRGCSSTKWNTRSLVHCVSLCELDKACIGASLDENEMCFHHKECPMLSGCSVPSTQHRYRKKHCAHGSWDMQTESCKCVDGFYGERCQQCHAKCSDLIYAGYETGYHRVYLDPEHNGQKPFLVNCYINPSNNYHVVIVMVNHGVEDFNKTWVDYVHGFYYGDSYWGGLYMMHRLSQAGCNTLDFSFTPTPTSNNTNNSHLVVFWQYVGFSVSSQNDSYSFTFQSSLSKSRNNDIPAEFYFGDCLEPLQNVPFSSWDANHDGDDDDNCAARAGSGWWYSGCNNTCNALGFGLQYLNTKPQHQVFSLVGANLSLFPSEEGWFSMMLLCI